jgi:hypothetical protein
MRTLTVKYSRFALQFLLLFGVMADENHGQPSEFPASVPGWASWRKSFNGRSTLKATYFEQERNSWVFFSHTSTYIEAHSIRDILYRQPGLLCTSRNFAHNSKFLGKKNLLLRLPLRHFLSFPKIWSSLVFRVAHKRNFNLVDETLIFQGHLNVFWGSFMALLCFSRWSGQKCCKTECVALKTSFQTSPKWALYSIGMPIVSSGH